MNNFENTKIAFAYKSNMDLKKAHLLFSVISHPYIVKFFKWSINLANSIHFPINWAVKPTVFKHFCGGETIEESDKVVRAVEKYNVKAILDYSVEGKEEDAEIEAALQETLKVIRHSANDKNIPFAVFKPTAFAKEIVLQKYSENEQMNEVEQKEFSKFEARVNVLCQTAFDCDIPIMLDAEDYCFQKAIDDTVGKMMQKYNKDKALVWNTLQMYRTDRLEFLKLSIAKARKDGYFIGIKFVRGAYMERERRRAESKGYTSPIHINKDETDKAYNEALKKSIENIDILSIFNGTHNEYSSNYLTILMQEKVIDKNDSRIYFSQLYGMSDNISFELADLGYNVAKYLPYGPVRNVLPYLMRRAEENTSIAGQTSRELSLIKAEVKRRKSEKK